MSFRSTEGRVMRYMWKLELKAIQTFQSTDCMPDLTIELNPSPDRSSARWNSLMESGSLVADFHMQYIYDTVGDDSDPELMKALGLLKIAIRMVKHGQGVNVVDFHLRKVKALGRDNEELDSHLHFLMECVCVMNR